VANGSIGASSRCSALRAIDSPAIADDAASSPRPPYARPFTSSTKSSQNHQKKASVRSRARA
jgi:hypothetical protein